MCGKPIFLELLRIVLSWPVASIFIGWAANKYYGQEFRSLLNRIYEGDIFGQRFKATPKISQNELSMDGMETDTPPPTSANSDSQNFDQTIISSEIKISDLPQEVKGDPNALEWIRYMVKNPVEILNSHRKMNQELYFERVYIRIYGSQVRLLMGLIENGGHGTLDFVSLFLEENRRASGMENTQLDSYISFLTGCGLMQPSSTPDFIKNQPVYEITNQGREFIAYTQARYPLLGPTKWG